ncbi:MAG: hypothetical protein AB1345_06385 [Chloroflexota bacterium]
MDKIREYLKNPWIALGMGFAIGVVIGLVVLGWWLMPVQWMDAAPAHLREDLKEDYLRMAIDSFSTNMDLEVAKRRWNDLGEEAPLLLAKVEENPGLQSEAAIAAFKSMVTGALLVGEIPTEEAVEGVASPKVWLPWMCGITLLFAAALLGIFYLRKRKGGARPTQVVSPGREPSLDMAESFLSEEEVSQEPPLAQFMTTYELGDDLYDNSFAIDSPSGEFLGECGVGISETIGVGDPKKVSAFELWLFDKNDIQTVTKVCMSAHLFNDEATRERLSAKGEPILVEPGIQIVLETRALQLVARVVDMKYGEGALPPESFFSRVTLEMAVWQNPPVM